MKISIINNIDSYIPQYILYSSNQIDREKITKESIKSIIETNVISNMPDENCINNEDLTEETGYIEGSLKRVFVNAYERNQKLRKACIEKYGAICSVCSFNFQDKYGDLGKGFIEVHHRIPLKNIRHGYIASVDDLIPVCSNCHSMLHKLGDYNMTINELKQIIERQK